MAKKIDLTGLDHFKEEENESIAYIESSSTASKAHKVGERFYFKGKLVICTVDIASGGTITLNTNCKLDVLGDDVTAQSEQIDAIGHKAYDVRRDLPSYYTVCSDAATDYDTSEYIEEKIASVPDGKHFIFITDTHWKTRNAKKSTMLVDYVKRRLGIKYVFFGGDILDQESTKYKGVARLKEFMNEQKSAFGKDYIVVPGNHDINVANYEAESYSLSDVIIPYTQAVKVTLSHLDNVVNRSFNDYTSYTSDSDTLNELHEYDKMHYYLDDDINQIRFIVLQTGNIQSGVVNDVFGARGNIEVYLQMEWFAQTLASVPANYDVVVLGHYFKNPTADSMADNIKNLFVLGYARKNKTTGTVYVPSTIGTNLADFYSKGNHSYDFSTASTIGQVIYLSGHIHYDWASIITGAKLANFSINSESTTISNGVLHIVSQCDQNVISTTPYIAEKEHVMTVGTITEQCFDVITIKNDKSVVCTRFGAGYDRNFSA